MGGEGNPQRCLQGRHLRVPPSSASVMVGAGFSPRSSPCLAPYTQPRLASPTRRPRPLMSGSSPLTMKMLLKRVVQTLHCVPLHTMAALQAPRLGVNLRSTTPSHSRLNHHRPELPTEEVAAAAMLRANTPITLRLADVTPGSSPRSLDWTYRPMLVFPAHFVSSRAHPRTASLSVTDPQIALGQSLNSFSLR
jgi:hypothetical protein